MLTTIIHLNSIFMNSQINYSLQLCVFVIFNQLPIKKFHSKYRQYWFRLFFLWFFANV